LACRGLFIHLLPACPLQACQHKNISRQKTIGQFQGKFNPDIYILYLRTSTGLPSSRKAGQFTSTNATY
jgi:hypothetical protein